MDNDTEKKVSMPPLCVVGASAGALDPLEELFCSAELSDYAVVLIQHQTEKGIDTLLSMMKARCKIDMKVIDKALPLKAGCFYVAPAGNSLTLENEMILPAPQTTGHSIDPFLQVLGAAHRGRLALVFLSGAGTDGTMGVRGLAEKNPLILVQKDPAFPGMPDSVLKTGLCQDPLFPSEMGRVLNLYADQSEGNVLDGTEERFAPYIDRIFQLIHQHTHHDFSQYKRNTLFRRIDRRMDTLELDSLEDFLSLLENDSNEVVQLYRELLIGVTRFFRDEETFNSVEKKILPSLLKNADETGLRVWVPACSSGEEAYSWAMLFGDVIEKQNSPLPLQIFGSDTDMKALERAREGVYPATVSDDIPPAILQRYFLPEGKGYRIKRTVRENIIFAEQNLIQDPPYSRIDMISCRNLLIYLNKDLQERILSMFHYALKPEGILILGNSETLGASAYLYEVVDKRNKIFRKLPNKGVRRSSWSLLEGFQIKKRDESKENNRPMRLDLLTEKILLQHYSPTAVLINPNGEILYVQGRTGKYLELSTGEISNNIMKTAREGLKIAMANAIRKSRLNNEKTVYKGLRLQNDEAVEFIDLIVTPVEDEEKGTGLLLVLFRPATVPDSDEMENLDKSDSSSTILELEKELSATQEYLQSTIEELETTNEELKSSNEEAQSTNEELQSANEELETSREELQSVNEELLNSNTELQEKIDLLSKANNDISNLLSSTQIATIFLDKDLRIFRFTPTIIQIMELLDTDVGRPITQFTNKLDYPNLAQDARRVLETLIPLEVEVKSPDGRFFWMRLLPYRTREDSIEGLVITFTDITEKKKQEAELIRHQTHLEELVLEKTSLLSQSEQRYRTLYENAPLPYQSLDKEGNLIDVNPAWLKLMGYSRKDVLGKWFGNFLIPASIEAFRLEFESFMKRGYCSNLVLSLRKNTGEIVHTSFEGTTAVDKKTGETHSYCTFKDISENKAYENELLLKNNALESALNGFCIIDSNQRFLYVNPAFATIWGFSSPDELLGRKPDILAEDSTGYADLYENLTREGKLDRIIRGKKKDGTHLHVRLQAILYTDSLGEEYVLGTNLDITDQIHDQDRLQKSEEKYRLLVENQTDLIVKVNHDGHFLYVSQSYCRTFGKKEKELLGSSFMPLVHEEDREVTHKAMEALNDPPYTCYLEQRAMTSRGWRWFSWVDKAILDENGQILEILGIGRDITDRKKAEEALVESEKRFRIISSLSSDYAYSLLLFDDGTMKYEWDFGAFEKLTGYNLQQIIEGTQLEKIYHPDDYPKVKESINKTIKGQAVTHEIRLMTQKGEIIWIREQGHPEWSEEDSAMRIFGNAQNITLQKQYEEQMKKQNMELQNTLIDLRETQDRLVHQERLAAMGQFSAGIAHDFNNILTGVLGTAEILRLDKHLTHSEQDHVQTIIDSGERAAQLVRQIMDYSRKSFRQEKNLDLKQMLKETIKIIRSGITEQYKITIRTSRFDGTEITADQTQMEQLVVNLVMNARDSMKKGGEILVELRNRHFRNPETCSICSNPIFGEYVEISVKDSGSGIDQKTQQSIFEPFFTTKDIGKGSGLGLAQVYGIVIQYKGHVLVESRLNEGSRFSILLPVNHD